MMMSPRIGALRHRVRLSYWSDQPVANAETERVHDVLATVWARVEPHPGSVYDRDMQISTDITHRACLRHVPGLTRHHILEHQDRRYRIRRLANPDVVHRFVELELEEFGPIPD